MFTLLIVFYQKCFSLMCKNILIKSLRSLSQLKWQEAALIDVRNIKYNQANINRN
jgi:hypothetical protein